ncbi:WD40 repeat protein [Actinoplanes tereljensis]|uniref:TIR domain-containing protein n=1 Tax=Paractinoplanes tereljensis TaxID=571912 RepID=A0A919TWC9_9ACTN|nr:TIR domain-containing protein [Actinoplanes tereljensis]GIF23165.1 hypothetical protein Ate02nite_58950 [Actinoplanes tereljensis]
MTVGYDVFISYSHSADGRLGPGLRDGLHQFARPWRRLRALRVFCDKQSLSANPAVWSTIATALDQSRTFVLLASPQAAQSPWVNREVERWLAMRPRRPLLIGLTDGEIAWDGTAGDFDWERTTALPESLRAWFDEEPLWIDLRDVRADHDLNMANPAFADRIATLAAPLHGRSKDELVGEDIRQHRRGRRFRRLSLAGMAVLTILALTAGATAYLQLGQARQQRDRATAQEREATARGLVFQAQTLSVRDPATAFRLELAAHALHPSPEHRATLAADLESSRFRGVRAQVNAAKTMVVQGDLMLVGESRQASLWDLREPARRLATLPAPGVFGASVALSADGRLALVGYSNCDPVCESSAGTADLWDVSTPRTPVKTATMDPGQGPIGAVALSPGGEIAFTATDYGYDDSSPTLWDIRDRTRPRLLTGRPTETASAAGDGVFSPHGAVMATGSGLWDISRPAVHRPLAQPADGFGPSAPAFRKDGDLLVAGGDRVTLWDVRDPTRPRVLSRITDFVHPISNVVFRGDGKAILAVSEEEHTVFTYDVSDPSRPVRTLSLTGPAGVLAAGFADQDSTVLALQSDGAVIAWDAAAAGPPGRTGRPAPVLAAVGALTSEGGDAILLAGFSGPGRYPPAARATISPDGRTAVATSGPVADTVTVYDVSDPVHPAQIITFAPQVRSIGPIASHPDGHTILIGGTDDTGPAVVIWDLADPRRPAKLGTIRRAKDGGLDALAVSPDGRTAFVGGYDEAALWDVTDLRRPRSLPTSPGLVAAAQSQQVTGATFSPDGHLLLVGGISHTTIVDTTDRDRTVAAGDLPGGVSIVSGVAISRTGQLAVTSGFAQPGAKDPTPTAVVWLITDPTYPRRIAEVPTQAAVAFAADGRTLVTENNAGLPLYWDITRPAAIAEDPIAYGCRLVAGPLNEAEWRRFVPALPYRTSCPGR